MELRHCWRHGRKEKGQSIERREQFGRRRDTFDRQYSDDDFTQYAQHAHDLVAVTGERHQARCRMTGTSSVM